MILANGVKVTILVTTASGNRALKKDLQSWASAHSFNDLLVDSERNSSQTPRHNHPYPCLFLILILWKATWVNDDTDVFCSITAQAAIAQFTSKHLLLNLPAISTKRFHKHITSRDFIHNRSCENLATYFLHRFATCSSNPFFHAIG